MPQRFSTVKWRLSTGFPDGEGLDRITSAMAVMIHGGLGLVKG